MPGIERGRVHEQGWNLVGAQPVVLARIEITGARQFRVVVLRLESQITHFDGPALRPQRSIEVLVERDGGFLRVQHAFLVPQ
jgi:hypothetical protein